MSGNRRDNLDQLRHIRGASDDFVEDDLANQIMQVEHDNGDEQDEYEEEEDQEEYDD